MAECTVIIVTSALWSYLSVSEAKRGVVDKIPDAALVLVVIRGGIYQFLEVLEPGQRFVRVFGPERVAYPVSSMAAITTSETGLSVAGRFARFCLQLLDHALEISKRGLSAAE